MRRLVTGKQMKEIDGYAIRKVGIPSLVLMERAALAVADEMEKRYGKLSGRIHSDRSQFNQWNIGQWLSASGK